MTFEAPTHQDTTASARLSTGFDSKILETDAAFTALTGWPAEEARGQTLAILFGPWSERAAVDRLVRAAERGEVVEPLAVKVYDFAGNAFDAEVALEADGPDHLRCLLRRHDGRAAGVAVAKGSEQSIAPSADRLLPALIDSLRDGIVVVDEEDRITLASEIFAQQAGLAVPALIGRPLAEVIELRTPPGDGSLAAANFLPAERGARGATVSMARGVDHRGRIFRVLTLRSTNTRAADPVQRVNTLEAGADVFEKAMLRRVDVEHEPVTLGLLEIVADDDLVRSLGSIWRDTQERARIAAAAVLAGELRPGELFVAVKSEMFLVFMLGRRRGEEALGRMQQIAQMTRHRLVREGGALASLEVFGGATVFNETDSALAAPRPNEPGDLIRRLADRIRQDNGRHQQVETVIADILDEGTVQARLVRSRDLAAARYAIAEFDDRSARWITWLRRRHGIEPALERELDIALAGRAVEWAMTGEGASLIMAPLHYATLAHAPSASRLTALVNGLPPAVRNRMMPLIEQLPPELTGERLVAFLRRLAGLGRGAWLVLDGLDTRGITGRMEGLGGVALNHARLLPRLEHEPKAVKQFIDHLRAANQPVLVFGIDEPEQASLLFGTFGITLAAGPGVEKLATGRP